MDIKAARDVVEDVGFPALFGGIVTMVGYGIAACYAPFDKLTSHLGDPGVIAAGLLGASLGYYWLSPELRFYRQLKLLLREYSTRRWGLEKYLRAYSELLRKHERADEDAMRACQRRSFYRLLLEEFLKEREKSILQLNASGVPNDHEAIMEAFKKMIR
jgi:hypothetical protein